MKKLVLFGTSAGAKLAHFYFTHDSDYEVAAFTVDKEYVKQDTFLGLPLVPFEEIEAHYPPNLYKMHVTVLASRVNKVRAEKYFQAKAKGYELATYISSKAIVWPGTEIGDNCFIGEQTVCKPFAKIGNNVIINGCSLIGHDSVIKDHCMIAAQASILGSVTVGEYCMLGGNSIILDTVNVADECIIGAGAVIHENTKEKEVYRAPQPTLLPLKSDRMAKLLFRGQ